MTEELEPASREAQARLSVDPFDRESRDTLLEAQRKLAAARSETYAEPIDLGYRWDCGAPLPQVVSSSLQTVVTCYANNGDLPGVDADDQLLEISFDHLCAFAVR